MSGAALSDSVGGFRISDVKPGTYRMRVEGLCLDLLERSVTVSTESPATDVGTLVVEHARPRLRLDHDICQATKEEDSETRFLLEAVASDSVWVAFGLRNAEPGAPVSSVWLRWGSSVTLFGEERTVLSPMDTGTSGLVTVADRRIYEGLFYAVSVDLAGANAVLTVLSREGPGTFKDGVLATFRRTLEGWTLAGVNTLGSGGHLAPGIP
jgi:hypothetical protein